jgi:hypothetical protein
MPGRDVRQVIDAICEAQRGGGLGEDQPSTPFIVVGLYLGLEDLKQIRPYLTANPDQPDLGQVGRYDSVPVFPLDARGVTDPPCASFDGIYFEYVPMDVVD